MEAVPAKQSGDDTEDPFGLTVDPAVAFSTAKEAAKLLHAVMGRLKAGKADNAASGSEATSCAADARELQLQLLVLRRAHRGMVRATEAGRVAEAAARKACDAEHAHLETRRYESACCRAAARRCRHLPTPELHKLRPLLEGHVPEEAEEEGLVAQPGGDQAPSSLAARLQAEMEERSRLATELAALDERKAKAFEAFRERERLSIELVSRLKNVEVALEPVCNLLELRPRLCDIPSPDSLVCLPASLRLVYSKFETLAAFGQSGGVAVKVEVAEPPVASNETMARPEKRPRAEATYVVVVEIEPAAPATQGSEAVVLRFMSPNTSLVTVAAKGPGADGMLAKLWLEDDGSNPALASLLPGDAADDSFGRPYAWAQVLAGLRDVALMGAPSLLSMDTVTATDVALRVRSALKKGA